MAVLVKGPRTAADSFECSRNQAAKQKEAQDFKCLRRRRISEEGRSRSPPLPLCWPRYLLSGCAVRPLP